MRVDLVASPGEEAPSLISVFRDAVRRFGSRGYAMIFQRQNWHCGNMWQHLSHICAVCVMSCSVHTALQLQVTLDVTAARRGQRAVARAAEWLKETS